MKYRTRFVSNSSSSSFLVAYKDGHSDFRDLEKAFEPKRKDLKNVWMGQFVDAIEKNVWVECPSYTTMRDKRFKDTEQFRQYGYGLSSVKSLDEHYYDDIRAKINKNFGFEDYDFHIELDLIKNGWHVFEGSMPDYSAGAESDAEDSLHDAECMFITDNEIFIIPWVPEEDYDAVVTNTHKDKIKRYNKYSQKIKEIIDGKKTV